MATTGKTRTSARRAAQTADGTGSAATGPEVAEAGMAHDTQHAHTATVNMPFVTAQFHAPDLHLPKPRPPEIRAALQTVRTFLPSRELALYYGGLALMAAFELVEWPVAAAIGVGTALARRGTGGDRGGTAGSKPPDNGSSTDRKKATDATG
jgi:hypothetical protein